MAEKTQKRCVLTLPQRAEPISGRSVGALRQCIGWIYNPIPGVRLEWAGRVCSVTPHPSQHVCADSIGAAGGTLGRLREVVRVRRRPAVVCTFGPASGQEKGGLEEVTEAVILLSSA